MFRQCKSLENIDGLMVDGVMIVLDARAPRASLNSKLDKLFNNKKGLIYGNDVKRIECDREGVLKIGDTDIEISQ